MTRDDPEPESALKPEVVVCCDCSRTLNCELQSVVTVNAADLRLPSPDGVINRTAAAPLSVMSAMSVHVGNGTGTDVAEDEDLCMRAVWMLTPRLFLNTLPHNLHVLCMRDCEIAEAAALVDSVHCCWLVEDRGESISGPTGQSGELIEKIPD